AVPMSVAFSNGHTFRYFAKPPFFFRTSLPGAILVSLELILALFLMILTFFLMILAFFSIDSNFFGSYSCFKNI
ncbi:MAG TPA: hypothetical protein VLK78_03355, partial [Candidatus Angelobacter sp.]|nr:hypothetical protein [Candidatus Angelobacter sp.]